MKDLFVELCLTVPVRLSSLLPYLPMLMDPLVSALNGSQTLINQVSFTSSQVIFWIPSASHEVWCQKWFIFLFHGKLMSIGNWCLCWCLSRTNILSAYSNVKIFVILCHVNFLCCNLFMCSFFVFVFIDGSDFDLPTLYFHKSGKFVSF